MNNGLATVNVRILEQELASGDNVEAFRRALVEVAIHLGGYHSIPEVLNGDSIESVNYIHNRLLTVEPREDIFLRMAIILFIRERCPYFTGRLPIPGDMSWRRASELVDQWNRPY